MIDKIKAEIEKYEYYDDENAHVLLERCLKWAEETEKELLEVSKGLDVFLMSRERLEKAFHSSTEQTEGNSKSCNPAPADISLTDEEKKYIKNNWGDWESIHSIHDELLIKRLRILAPDFMKEIDEIFEEATFWYA